MATTTPRIGLTKPDGTDLVDIAVLNTNFDKIDSNIASTKIQSTKPATANAGDLWWDSDTGTLYLYYTDANSSQWVAATSDPINIGVVASQAERDAQYPTPAQGMSVYRTDLGVTQRYYGLYNVSTNPGGKPTAGWYVDEALPPVVANATVRDARFASPIQGATVFRQDTGNVEIYNGSSWAISSSVSAWTAYTPTLYNATIGNGVVSFYYKLIGKTAFVRGRFSLGSTSSIGTLLDWSLPFAVAPTTLGLPVWGLATFYNGGIFFGSNAYIGGTAMRTIRYIVSGTNIVNSEISPTAPFTWTAGCHFDVEFSYEVA